MHLFTTFYVPMLIYSVMGVFIARIQLSEVNPKQFNWLAWLQFAVDALRIVFLWPLVLFIEKSKSWLEEANVSEDHTSLQKVTH